MCVRGRFAPEHPADTFTRNACHNGLWRLGVRLRGVAEVSAALYYLEGVGKAAAIGAAALGTAAYVRSRL